MEKQTDKLMKIEVPTFLFIKDYLVGESLDKSYRSLGELDGVFCDLQAYMNMDKDQIVYEVCSLITNNEEMAGSLNFGITKIFPGKVGKEYFMTKGHFHQNIDSGEFYWGIEGEGMLILMDEDRTVWGEKMFPGSLHYIKPGVAHRVANVGNEALSFAACWPSDAGHNYEEILKNGFSASLQDINGIPKFI